MPYCTGEDNGRSKLTVADVAAIRGSQRATKILVQRYGVAPSTVQAIRAGTIWRGVEAAPPTPEEPTANNPALIGEWRAVPGYEGVYDVSAAGQVRVWSAKIEAYTGHWPSLIAPRKSKQGYIMATLWRARVAKRTGVHRLVAAAFIGPRPEGKIVLHYDGNKLNNHFSNLRYGTHVENVDDAVRHGTRKRKAHG